MAEFSSELQSLKLSFPFMEADPNVEPMNQVEALNPSLFHDFQNMINFHPFLSFTNDVSFSHHTTEFSENLSENFPSSIRQLTEFIVPASEPTVVVEENERQKRKSIKVAENSSTSSCVQVCDSGIHRKNGSGRGKKAKRIEKEEEEEEGKPKEVVHVRAKRGQATDSHSIAERVRRGKINERLRHLQDIVPGCYKTMGMAVMLDEIINYVQSLQNQVEFLSMKLTAASSFYDFNSETDALESFQRAKAKEGKEVERYGGLLASTQAWPL